MRNQLLNFKPRTLVIKVIDEIPTEIYDIIVLQEKKMEFLPIKGKDDENNENSELTEEESDLLWELPPPDRAVDDRHKDLFLQTNHSSKELQKRLFKIYQKAKSIFEEQGYIVSYLALGFLEWKETEQSEDCRKAPLILIPIRDRT